MSEPTPEGAGSDTVSMQRATSGQDAQSLLFGWSGQQGMSSDIACISSLVAASILVANTGAASGPTTSPAATESIIQKLMNRFSCIAYCRMSAVSLQSGTKSRNFCQSHPNLIEGNA